MLQDAEKGVISSSWRLWGGYWGGRDTLSIEKLILVLTVEVRCQTSLLGLPKRPPSLTLSIYTWEGHTDGGEGEH